MRNNMIDEVYRNYQELNRMPLLEARDLTIGYKSGKQVSIVAKNLNLKMDEGQFTCLIGANGSGKSTLLRTLAGVQKCLEGNVEITQQNIRSLNKSELSKKLSLVLAGNVNATGLTVYEILTLGRYPYTGWFGLLQESDIKIIQEAVESTGIARFLNHPVHSISDGEKQKVMIARALIQDTPVIILDEPTAHLDLPNRVAIMQLLRKMVCQTGKAVLLSTHELDLALQSADELWVMMPDKSVITGAPEDLILNGTFKKAFQKEGFDFNIETGTFKVNDEPPISTVKLIGEKSSYHWTKRALERKGFAISDSAALEVAITEQETFYQWHMIHLGITYSFNSIKELLIFMKRNNSFEN